MGMTIDQKIVEMRFENKNFEENVQESISTLGRLKESLHFDNVSSNFDDIAKASSKLDFGPLGNAVESIAGKFTALGVAGVAACTKIVHEGIDLLEKGIKSLSVDQFTEGWKKFGDKTESVGTIMAATGLTMDEVNAQLERLLWFADETSYSFTDMTSNVGKFTSVGVDLEDAVEAMEGIATWAALTGANTQTASRAMYNLSQAMGMGKLTIADWRSIELAGMATMEFKEMALETGAALGKIRAYADGTYQYVDETGKVIDITAETFRESLKSGWLDKDVMMSTFEAYGKFANELSYACEDLGMQATDFMQALEKYDGSVESLGEFLEETGLKAEDVIPIFEKLSSSEYELARKAFVAAQASKTFSDSIEATKDAVSTQWMKTFEYLFGNYEQAKTFFTGVTDAFWDIFATSGEVRNEVLKQWSSLPLEPEGLTGGDMFRTGLLNILESVANVVTKVEDAFFRISGIFSTIEEDGAVVTDSTEAYAQKLLEHTKAFLDFTDNLKEKTSKLDLSRYIESISHHLSGVGAILKVIWDIWKALTPALSAGLGIIAKIADFLAYNVLFTFGDWLKAIGDFIHENEIMEKVVSRVSDFIVNAFARIKEAVSPITNLFTPLIEKFKAIFSADGTQYDIVYNALSKIYEKFKEIFDVSINWEKVDEYVAKVKEKLQNAVDFCEKLIGKFSKLKEFFTGKDIPALEDTFASGKMEHIPGLIDKISDSFSKFKEKLGLSEFKSFGDVIDKIKSKLRSLKEFFTGKDIPALEDTFASGKMEHIPGLLDKISDGFSKLKEKLNAVKEKLSAVKEFFLGKDVVSPESLFGFGPAEMEHIPGVLDKIREGFSKIKEAVQNIDFESFKQKIEEIKNSIKEKFELAGIKSFSDLLDKIKEKLKPLAEALKVIAKIAAILGGITIILATATIIGLIAAFVKLAEVIGKVIVKAKELWSQFKEKIAPEWLEKYKEIFEEIKEHITPLIDKVKEFFNATSSDIDITSVKSFDDILEKIKSKLQLIKEFFTGKDIPALEDTFASGKMEHIPGLLDKISDGFSKLKEKLGLSEFKSFDNILEKIKNKLQLIKEFFTGKDIPALEDTFAFGKMEHIPGLLDKISDGFSKLKEKLGLSEIKSFSDVLEKIKSKLRSLKEFFLGKDVPALEDMFASGKMEHIPGLLDKIKEKLEPVSNKLKEIFTNIKGFFKNLNFSQIFGNIWKTVSDLLGQLWDKLLNIDYSALAGRISSLFKSIAKGITTMIGKIDSETLLKNLEELVMIFGGINLGKLFGSLSKKIGGGDSGFLESLIKPVNDLFNGIKDSIGGFAEETNSGKLLKIASAIGILTVALVALASIDPKNISDVLTMLGSVLGGALLGSGIMSRIDSSGTTNLIKAALAMVLMAEAAKIMVDALKPIADMNATQLEKMGGALVAIFGSMLTFVKLFSKFNSEHDAGNASKAAFAMVEIGIAMKLMVSALKSISELEAGDYGQAIGALAAIFIAMSGLLYAAGKFKAGGGQMMGIGFAMVEIGLAIDMMVPALKSIAQLEGGDYTQAIGALAAIFIAIGGLTFAAGKFKAGGGQMIGIGFAMVEIGLAIDMMVPALKSIAQLNKEEYIKAIGALGALFAATAGLSFVVGKWGAGGARMLATATAMIAMAAAMHLFASAGRAMANVKWEDLGKIGAILGGIVLAGLVAGIPIISAGLMAISIVLVSIGASVTLIGAGVALIGAGLLMIATAIGMIHIGELIGSLSTLTSALSMEAAVAAFKAAMDLIKEIILGLIDTIEAVAPRLAEAMVKIFLEILTTLSENLSDYIKVIADILIQLFDGLIEYVPKLVEGLVKVLVTVFDSLSEHIPTLLASFMNFLGKLFDEILSALNKASPNAVQKMIEMVGFIDALIVSCALLGPLIPGAMAGLVQVGLFVAELSAVIAALGALTHIDGFTDLVEEGGGLLQKVGEALGKFVGGFVGGTLEGATASLPAVGTNLSDFWTNISPFIEGVAGVDDGVITSISNLAGAMLALTAADLIEGIASFITGESSFKSFGEELAEFGPSFKTFADSVNGINVGSVMAASLAIKTVADTFNQDVFKSGGLKQLFTGETNLSHFATGLAMFGPSFSVFANSVKSFDDTGIEKTCNAVSKVAAAFNKQAFRSGGVLGFFSGDINLLTFAEGLAQFGPKLVAYGDSVKSFDDSGIEKSSTAVKTIADAFNKDVFKSGGLKQLIDGQTDFKTFVTGLAEIGPSLFKYSLFVAKVDDNVGTKSETICGALSKMLSEFPKKDLWETVFGSDGTSNFVDDLSTLGDGLLEYQTKISGINTEQIGSVTTAVKNLLDAVSGTDTFFVGINSEFAIQMADIAKKGIEAFLQPFDENMEPAQTKGSSLFGKVIEGIKTQEDVFKTAIQTPLDDGLALIEASLEKYLTNGTSIMTNVKDGVEFESPNFITAMETIMTNTNTAINNFKSKFNTSGRKLMESFKSGIKMKNSEVVRTVEEIVSDMIQSIEDRRSDFNSSGSNVMIEFGDGISSVASSVETEMYNIGANIALGLANGMWANLSAVQAAAQALANAAASATSNTLKVASPSRVFYGIGKYVVEGFVNGISSEIHTAEKKSEDLGNIIVSGISEALAENLQNDLDDELVIRPVLDISDIEDGSRKINSMFSTRKAFAVGADIGNISKSAPYQSTVDNSKNFGGFTFNIYAQSGNAENIAKEIGIEVNRRIRQFSTI